MCRRTFPFERALHQHQKDTGHSETPKCKECGKTFGSGGSLKQHQEDTGHSDRSDSWSEKKRKREWKWEKERETGRERERRGGQGREASQGSNVQCRCQACSYRVERPEKECKYGSKCGKSECRYAHPSPSCSTKRRAGRETGRCRYGIRCNDIRCEFSHPSPARKCQGEKESGVYGDCGGEGRNRYDDRRGGNCKSLAHMHWRFLTPMTRVPTDSLAFLPEVIPSHIISFPLFPNTLHYVSFACFIISLSCTSVMLFFASDEGIHSTHGLLEFVLLSLFRLLFSRLFYTRWRLWRRRT